jgi:hypothetical protein
VAPYPWRPLRPADRGGTRSITSFGGDAVGPDARDDDQIATGLHPDCFAETQETAAALQHRQEGPQRLTVTARQRPAPE